MAILRRNLARRTLLGGTCFLTCVMSLQAQDRLTALDGQALDWFGFDVAMSGDYGVVGAWRDDDAGANTGSAHVVYTPGTSPAAYLQKLNLSDMQAGDLAGMSVAMGTDVIAISAPGRAVVRANGDVVTGIVAVFEEVSGVWTMTATLDTPSRTDGDLFGSGIAITDSSILVGASRDDEFAPDGGALFVFQRSGGTWALSQKIAPTDVGTHDYFGHDVCAAGTFAGATSYNDDDRGVNAGAAYVLEEISGIWDFTQKLTGSEGNSFDLYGTCIAMTEESIVVGAPQNEDLDDAASVNEGCVFVYEWSKRQGEWVETGCLRPGRPNDDHRFGIDVAINENVVIVGASHSDAGVINSGTAHVFGRRSRDCFEVSHHSGTVPQSYDYLGLSVAAGTNAVMVGVPGANEGAVGAGAVDVLDASGKPQVWGSTFCHSDERVGGFRNMGGERNNVDKLGRLMNVGTPSVSRDDMIMRGTSLPTGAYATLLIADQTGNSALGDGTLCVRFKNGSSYQFPYKQVAGDGRYIVRSPIGKIESAFPGTTSAFVGTSLYGQIAYYDPANGRWNTTNAIRMEFED